MICPKEAEVMARKMTKVTDFMCTRMQLTNCKLVWFTDFRRCIAILRPNFSHANEIFTIFNNIFDPIRLQSMCMNKSAIYLLLMLVCGLSYAQDTRNPETIRPTRPQYQPVKKKKKGVFGFLKKDQKQELKTAEEESAAFRARVSQAYRENTKEAIKAEKVKIKEARKGESFYGHKRPPKKRPPGKQKFCKVCKIKH